MNAQAIVDRETTAVPGTEVAPGAVPAAMNLTPMQMAYQLVQSGRDFAAVREMLDYSRQIEREEAEKAFNASMTAAQAEMRPISADAENPQTRSRYASYAALDKALRPIYTKHGFALSFDEGDTDKPDHIRVLCYVTHQSGHARTYHKDMPADGKGAKGGDVMTKTHASGAADTYGMRYVLKKIFNVAIGEHDKDGNAPTDTLTEDRIEELKGLIDKAVAAKPGTDYAAWLTSFLEYMKVAALNDIPAKDFGKAKSAIENAIRQAGK